MVLSAGHSSDQEEIVQEKATTAQGALSSHGDQAILTQTAGLAADDEAAVHETSSRMVKDSTVKDAALAVGVDSEWQDSSCRHVQNLAENSNEASTGLISGTEMSLLSMGTIPVKSSDEMFEATEQGGSVAEPEETRPASVW